MIWIFEREEKRATLQLLYLAPDKYELHLVDADSVDHVEHFTNATDAGNRQDELLQSPVSNGWAKTGGWKL